MTPMSYEDVTYALDAAGTQTVSLPSNAATPLTVLVTVDGRQHEFAVSEVRCAADDAGELSVALVCGSQS